MGSDPRVYKVALPLDMRGKDAGAKDVFVRCEVVTKADHVQALAQARAEVWREAAKEVLFKAFAKDAAIAFELKDKKCEQQARGDKCSKREGREKDGKRMGDMVP